MTPKYAPLLAVFLLAACDGNPFGGIAPPPVTPPVDPTAPVVDGTVPAVLRQNLFGATYDPVGGTLTVDLRSLDGTPVTASYTRNAAFDLGGYEAYTAQETTSQRYFLALVKKLPNGAEGITVADGGQFANYFGGGSYARMDTFTLPSSGLASYAGSYVGLLNTGVSIPGPGVPFDPARSNRVTGTVLLNADFNEGGLAVNGVVGNRTVVETGDPLDPALLWVTGIDPTSGAFQGKVHLTPQKVVGDYGGLFAGIDAAEVSAVLVFKPIDGNDDLKEHGLFVLPKCVAGAAAPCP